jgi:Ca2+-binding RTX toxin-like protein
MPDDHSNTTTGATELTLGTDFFGTLDYYLDVDFFSIHLLAGQTYRFDFELEEAPFPALRLGILDSNGNYLNWISDVTFTALTFRPTVSGQYFLEVSNHYLESEGDETYEGDYTGSVQVIADDFPKKPIPSDGAIGPGDTVAGTVDYKNDTDAVRINVEEAGIYRVTLNDASSDLWANLNQPYSSETWRSDSEGNRELLFVAGSETPVEFSVRGATAGATYSYTVERIGTDDHSDEHAKATQLQDGDALDSNIAFVDEVDAFEIAGVAGSTYTVTIDLTEPSSQEGLYTSLRDIYDEKASATKTTTATQITYEWTLRTDTSYFLEVGSGNYFTRGPDYTAFGDYTVSLAVVKGQKPVWGNHTDELFLGTDEAELFRTQEGNDTVHSGKGDDSVYLMEGDDYVIAGGGRELFHGGGGHDRISYYYSPTGVKINLETNEVSGSRAANDEIFTFESADGSNTGNDIIWGTSSDNTIRTHGGDDRAYAGKGNDRVFLGAGDDYVLVGGGAEEFHGGEGSDHISYYKSRRGVTVNLETNDVSGSWAENDTISGFENVSGSKTGHDRIYGTAGANTIKTYSGNDKVYARGGDDRVLLGDGNDYVLVGDGAGTYRGGDGNDYISYYHSTGGVELDLDSSRESGGWAENDSIHGFESASGSKTGNDVIYGTAGANTIKTYGGNDKVYARGGDDRVLLGDGNDYVLVGDGAGTYRGGDGNDYISYYNHANGVSLNLETNSVMGAGVDGHIISGFENASGSETGSDTIYGSATHNRLKTYGGDDLVHAGRGRDTVYSGTGNDQVFLGDGDDFAVSGGGTDHYDGGSGFDMVNYTNSASGVVIDLAANTASGGWAEGDTLVSIEGISGSDGGHDQLAGNAERNYLDGFAGNDTLYGRDGDDLLAGRAGDDVLFGGNGDDRLSVGAGTNAMTGGSGYDTFDFKMEDFEGGAASHTVIEDFEDDVDTLEINSSGQVDEDIISYATQQGNDVVFSNFGNTTLIIRDMTIADLQDDVDFNWI